MSKFLFVLPVAAAIFLGACNANSEVNTAPTNDEALMENSTDRENEMRETDDDMMNSTPSPTSGVMMEDDGNTLRMEGGVDTGR